MTSISTLHITSLKYALLQCASSHMLHQHANVMNIHMCLGSYAQDFVRTNWVQADEPPMCGIIMPSSHHV